MWRDSEEPLPFSAIAERSLHVHSGQDGIEIKRWIQKKTSGSELVSDKVTDIAVHAWSPSRDIDGHVSLRMYWHTLPKGTVSSTSWAYWRIPSIQNVLYESGSLNASLRKDRAKAWRDKVSWLLDIASESHCRTRGLDAGKHVESVEDESRCA
eukprot:2299287-Amphidinium_carterae.1